MFRREQLTLRQLWAFTIVIGVFIFINTSQIVPNDFWWHMAVGREIVTTRQIPGVDTYSYTATGLPYISYRMFWLMDVWLYLIFKLGGPQLILFTHSLIISGAYFIVMFLCWKSSQKWGVTALATFFAVFIGIYTWNVRPQAISFLIGALFLLAIYQYRWKPNPAWLVVFPLGMLVWANSHGSFLVGVGMVGIWFVAELGEVLFKRWKHEEVSFKRVEAAGAALILTILACLVTPLGLGSLSYVRGMFANPTNQKYVPEWAPPSFNSPNGPIFFISLQFSSLILAVSPKRPSFYQILNFVVFALAGIMTIRMVIWFGIMMAPILADHLAAISQSASFHLRQKPAKPHSRPVYFAFLALIIFLAVFSLPWLRELLPMPVGRQSLYTQSTPFQATQILIEQQLPNNLFHDMTFGSYLIWLAQPEYPVFVDSRVELYPDQIWMDYLQITTAKPGWQEKLDAYGVNTLMLKPDDQAALVNAVDNSPGWDKVYQDATAIIYLRSGFGDVE